MPLKKLYRWIFESFYYDSPIDPVLFAYMVEDARKGINTAFCKLEAFYDAKYRLKWGKDKYSVLYGDYKHRQFNKREVVLKNLNNSKLIRFTKGKKRPKTCDPKAVRRTWLQSNAHSTLSDVPMLEY